MSAARAKAIVFGFVTIEHRERGEVFKRKAGG
jgi:hypothetical protein